MLFGVIDIFSSCMPHLITSVVMVHLDGDVSVQQ